MENMETLDTIGVRHKTDQSSLFHGYLDILEPHFAPFRENPVTFIEIGVASGASLKTWLDYFPRGQIIGIDHNKDVESIWLPERGATVVGDAADASTWESIKRTYGQAHIIQDDGGHYSRMIIPAFHHAWRLLRPGGIYTCQDLHQIWRQEYPYGEQKTAFEFFVEKMHEMNEQGEGQCAKPVKSDIHSIHFHKSLVIIKKR